MPNTHGPLPRRISVVGTTGSGKSTFACTLAETLGIEYIELDSIQWLPNWQSRKSGDFIPIVLQRISAESWVVDGNYHITRDKVWERATDIIWIDHTFSFTMWRLFKRTIRRARSGEELWSGNKERLRTTFFSKDSILWWCIKTYHKNKRTYTTAMKIEAGKGKRCFRVRSDREGLDLIQRMKREGDVQSSL